MKDEFVLSQLGSLVECLNAALESLSACVVTFAVCVYTPRVRPLWVERIRKSKKKKDASYAKYAVGIDLLYDLLEQLLNTCAHVILALRDRLGATTITTRCEHVFSHAQATFTNPYHQLDAKTTFANISSSYNKAFDDLKKCFGSKVKILLKLSSTSPIDLNDFLDRVKSKHI